MPWHVVQEDASCSVSEPWGVRKDDDNSLAGCHGSEAEAVGQIAALYAAEADRSVRMEEETVHPLSPRQKAQYEATESLVELFGQYSQGVDADGAHYAEVSPYAADGMVCSSCVFFEGGRGCEVVAGDIAPEGICKLWVIPADLMTNPEPMVEDEPVVEVDPEPVVEVEPVPVVEIDGYKRGVDGVDLRAREVRNLEKLEVRATPDGGAILEGYATVYDYAYSIGDVDRGGFMETIVKGSAAKSAAEADVRLLINHEGIPLARTRSGTMTLESDDIGLRVTAQLDPQNPLSASLRSAMERGDMDQMSFAFRVLRDEWNSDYSERKIYELKLFDVSMVTYPANPATVAKVRSDDPQDSEHATGRSVEMAKRQLEAIPARR
jgi:HK97 family phage prohead protease